MRTAPPLRSPSMSATRRPSRRLDGHLTTGEAARVLGVHADTVLRWCKMGFLRAIKPRTHWRIPEDALAANVTVAEAAARLRASKHAVRTMCEDGTLVARRLRAGGWWRILAASLHDNLARMRPTVLRRRKTQ